MDINKESEGMNALFVPFNAEFVDVKDRFVDVNDKLVDSNCDFIDVNAEFVFLMQSDSLASVKRFVRLTVLCRASVSPCSVVCLFCFHIVLCPQCLAKLNKVVEFKHTTLTYYPYKTTPESH